MTLYIAGISNFKQKGLCPCVVLANYKCDQILPFGTFVKFLLVSLKGTLGLVSKFQLDISKHPGVMNDLVSNTLQIIFTVLHRGLSVTNY